MAFAPPYPEDKPDTIKRRRAVKWLSVRQLILTGIEVARVGSFTRFADKREVMATTPREHYSMQPPGTAEQDVFWMDYTADTGDGFDATLTVASLLAGGSTVDWEAPMGTPHPPPQGPYQRPMSHLLVLGGDEVYPVATEKNYETRFWQVFGYARRWASGIEDHNASYSTAPKLAALPGNHDWYDGLVTFRQLFCESWVSRGQREPIDRLVRVGDEPEDRLKPDAIGGWGTFQSRSYFAVHLWGDWWLWGVDSQLNRDVDAHQIEYFTDAADKIGADGQVILCTATPAWLEADVRDPRRTDSEPTLGTMLWFIYRTLGKDRRDRVRLILTGDKHHYVRYECPDQVDHDPPLVTCGGGGAFLSSTHNLPERLSFQWRRWNRRQPQPEAAYVVASNHDGEPAMFPTKDESRANVASLGWLAVAWRNGLLLPILIALLNWSASSALSHLGFEPIDNDGAFRMSTAWAWMLLGVYLAALGGFATKGAQDAAWPAVATSISKRLRVWAAFLFLLVVHVVFQLVAICGACALTDWLSLDDPLSSVVTLGLLAVFGVLAFAAYLHAADLLGLHDLEAYSAMGLTGYKSIVRLRFASDGVTAYVWGVRDVPSYGRKATPPQRTIRAHLVDRFPVTALGPVAPADGAAPPAVVESAPERGPQPSPPPPPSNPEPDFAEPSVTDFPMPDEGVVGPLGSLGGRLPLMHRKRRR